LNVAVTERFALILTVQAFFPEQSPCQPEKLEPAPALAVSFTETLEEKLAEQVVPQLTPDGLLVTVPEPLPALAVTSAFGALALAQLGKRKAPIRVWSSPPLEA